MMPGPPWATYDEMRGVRSCETKVRVDVRQHGPPTFKPDLIIEHDKEGALQRVPVTVNVSMLDFEVKIFAVPVLIVNRSFGHFFGHFFRFQINGCILTNVYASINLSLYCLSFR